MRYLLLCSLLCVPLRGMYLPAAGSKPALAVSRIAVLELGAGLPDGFRTAHPPAEMARVLRKGGFEVTLITPEELADPTKLSPAAYGAVVLPSGPYFPAGAKPAFLGYLKAGGSFLSTDGYAFDRLVVRDGGRWVDAPQPAGALTMNTRRGTPGDAESFAPEQVGVFDPCFTLEHAVALKPMPGWEQSAKPRKLMRSATGFAACALLGDNNPVFPPVYRRWVPVLEAVDAAGAERGAALAIAHNFAGPFAGSSWAFSGLTSGEDLFLGTSDRNRLLLRVVREITQKVYLHSPATDLACYRTGESVIIRVQVTNRGRLRTEAQVSFNVSGKLIGRQRISLAAGETRTVSVEHAVTASTPDLCHVEISLARTGETADRLATAFCVWRPEVVARGPKVGWRDNYLTLNGLAHFLAGTNATGMMFYSEHEDPAIWDRDLRRMAANEIRILRILHFSPFAAKGYQGNGAHTSLDLANRPERLCRQLDAIVQIAQKHGVVIFLTLHDWVDVNLTDAELRAQADWARFWAARYRDVPGIMFDVQNEPSMLLPSPKTPERWDDMRAVERKRREIELLNRWVKANVDGVKAGNPNALVTVGYLPDNWQADKMLGTRHVDFANSHFYGSTTELPLELKLTDRRAYGRGFSLGEFGAQEAHDARTHGETGLPVEVSIRRFEQTLHYAVGLGASFAMNWDWKEMDEAVFPWGLVQRGEGVPKPWLKTFADDARFLSGVELAYRSPEVFLLAPDSHRLGAHFGELHRALQRSAELLIDQRVDFAVMNENVAAIPPSAKLLVWPLPYCPDDAAFARVLAWVRAGGTLYLSGDIAFDANRLTTRRDRRTALGIADDWKPVEPLADRRLAARPTTAAIGQGQVVYAPYPLELRPRSADQDEAYTHAINQAGIPRIPAGISGGTVRIFGVDTKGGGRLYSLVRTDDGRGTATVRMPRLGRIFQLCPGGCAFIVTDARRRVVATHSTQ